MNTFRLRKVLLAGSIIRCGYPLYPIIILLVVCFYVLESKWVKFIQFISGGYVPFIILALALWFAYELRRLFKDLRFFVRLDDEGIKILDRLMSWKTMDKVIIKDHASGRQPAITLIDGTGYEFGIPAAIEDLAYIRGVVESKMKKLGKSADLID